MWYAHTIECYLYLTKEENPFYATTWMKLENVMLISQTLKDKYCMTPLIRRILNSQIHRNRVKWWLPEAGGRGNQEILVKEVVGGQIT